jgi:hypothetical protein
MPLAARRVLLIVFATACGSATGVTADLAAARMRWARQGPADYTMTVARSCECLPEWTGPVVVTVRNGTIASRRYVRTGAAVPARYETLFPSVEGLFARIDSASRQRVHELRVDYHPTLGYPTRISIDQNAQTVDDEVTITVPDFATP